MNLVRGGGQAVHGCEGSPPCGYGNQSHLPPVPVAQVQQLTCLLLLKVTPVGSHEQESRMPRGGGAPSQVMPPVARPGDRHAQGREEQQLSGSPAVSVLLASNV